MTFSIEGFDLDESALKEVKAVAVDMWYDRHYRHWVIYPVDADGNQMREAVYGFGKPEATRIRKEIEAEYGL